MMKQIRKAFSPLHASEDTLQKVLQHTKKDLVFSSRKVVRAVLLAATLAAAMTISVCAADYLLNDREVFFFDTLDALAAKQSAEHPTNAISYGVPGTAEESEQIETSVEYVTRVMERGLHEEENILSRESTEDGSRMTAQYKDEIYGTVNTEYCAYGSLANLLQIDGFLNWDLSFLSNQMTPDPNGQILAIGRSASSDELLWVKAHMGYTPQEGKRFSISYQYTPDFDYGKNPEYVLSSAYDRSEIFVTQDKVNVLVQEYDGQIWANAARGYKSISIYTNGCTFEQVETILDHLCLEDVLA
ncbi:hypothetical protein [uncultured Ruthenibacterium sp.]|uniref:hypothetical protein n=1 Tax=uncultured Ruthenibacterium sp. TaxID=1905347 RepID=UPI00349EA3EF